MAKATVPLKGAFSSGRMDLKLPLLSKDGKETASTLELSVIYKKPASAAGAAGTTGTTGGGGITVNQDTGSSTAAAAAGAAGAAGGDSASGSPGESDISAGVSFGDVSGGITGSGGVVRHRHEAYSTKADDYQIRVKVIEARQLQGGNITPICKVNCAGKNRETRVKSPTHSPYWNEIFYFNFHEAPSKLFEQMIQFSVYNAKKLRQDALIGSFKFDLSLVYEQDRHALLNKWLLLCDPEDHMSGAKGYLKISIVILGPGDEPVSMKVDDSDEQDIEANLLRPAGVQLRPAVLKIRLYKAEDLPQMDADTLGKIKNVVSSSKDDKEYCDPYVEFSFAGTKMKSSKKYETANPEWNEEIILNHQVSPVCSVSHDQHPHMNVGSNDSKFVCGGLLNCHPKTEFLVAKLC
ncbi:unnamed protein product [Echinostoma caproni]|uniref:C2 domain-containing protein n=1 Tax=Echinostoma caproni TaxID=27848 RepID=A0A183A7T3_9TREM|nr:unnamed protein product [Echinostoma caproni]